MNAKASNNIESFIAIRSPTISGYFETNGLVAKFESKSLHVELAGERASIKYEQGVVSINDIDVLMKHISGIMEIMQQTNQEKE